MPSPPVVAIVGRPNVGKSSLLNALVGKRISIVQDMPGVTRDRVSTPLRLSTAEHGDRYVEVVDTGGYGFVDAQQLTEHIHHQIELAMARADLVLLVVDCQAGLTSADAEIAALLRRKGIKTVILANKADGPKADVMLGDFARLGLGTPLGISAMNDRNIDQVYRAIEANVDLSDAPTEMPEPQMLVAIVGKRNAGKSTLVNSIAQVYEGDGAGDRVIVSEVPGTTRDSIDVRFEKDGKTLVVIDTAGVRKKRLMVTNDIEYYSFHRAERSIRRAHVVLMLVDATEPVSEPDKKLASYIAQQHKPVLLVINKWDLAKQLLQERAREQGKTKFDDHAVMAEYREYLDAEFKHLDFAPIAFVTAKEGRNVQGVLDMAQHLFKQSSERVATHKLTTVVRQILSERHPSTKYGRSARIYYVTQTDVNPPTVVLFVNNPSYFDESYQRYMINRLRELLPFAEVPIRLVIRERQRQDMGDEIEPTAGKRPAKRAKPARKPARKHKTQSKPRPKPASGKGAARGTRPR